MSVILIIGLPDGGWRGSRTQESAKTLPAEMLFPFSGGASEIPVAHPFVKKAVIATVANRTAIECLQVAFGPSGFTIIRHRKLLTGTGDVAEVRQFAIVDWQAMSATIRAMRGCTRPWLAQKL